MGFRFRRSVKIAPGIRLNLGKRGASVSIGGRGAKVTIGNGRTTTTLGIPGTGLSYSEVTSHRKSGPSIGSVSEVTPKKARQLQLAAEADSEIQKELQNYDSFLKIANASEAIKSKKDFDKELITKEFTLSDYNLQKNGRWFYIKYYFKKFSWWLLLPVLFAGLVSDSYPVAQKIFLYTALASVWAFILQAPFLLIFGFVKSKKLVVDNNNKIAEAKTLHPAIEMKRIEQLKSIYKGDEAEVEAVIETAIEGFSSYISCLPYKFDLNTSYEFQAGNTVVLDTDLPEIENVTMTEVKKALKTGEVSVKEKKEKDINTEYATGVIGIAFNLAARIFNSSPCIEHVIITGYTQRLDQRTGKIRDHYVYMIKFNRSIMFDLNLAAIDPLKGIENFEYNMALDKNNFLQEIELKKTA